MEFLPDFYIQAEGLISNEFLNRDIHTFGEAAAYVRELPYGRNADKKHLETVFANGCGTCSTKHALLKKLAEENGLKGLRLVLGIFKMNAVNTPKIAATLRKHSLEYIPEAHNYLRFENLILDFTARTSAELSFLPDLLEEIELQPDQITDFKIAFHQNYLNKWLASEPAIPFTLEEIWRIREQCIKDLSAPSHQ